MQSTGSTTAETPPEPPDPSPIGTSGHSPRWRYAPIGVLFFLLLIQLVTGVLMMSVYSASPATAWGSVLYLQNHVPGGASIRILHNVASNAMLIVLGLHIIHWVIGRLYRADGLVAWWITLGLFLLVLAIALTGELLPWDQHGYWGTRVRTNILARTPWIGDSLRRLLLGGSEFGHLTLARFYALHNVVLPLLLALLIGWQVVARRRASTPSSRDCQPVLTALYGSGQFGRDSVAFAVVFVLICFMAWNSHSSNGGSFLDAPADPIATDYPARPEWHTLFFYQGLKSFHGPTMEMLGAIVLPGFLFALFLIFPFLDRAKRRVVAVAPHLITLLVIGAAGLLSYAAMRDDARPSDASINEVRAKQDRGDTLDSSDERVLRAWEYHRQLRLAMQDAKRSFELAEIHGIPPEGPLALLRNDPLTRGPKLFAAHCSSCHRMDGHNGLGNSPNEAATASDLAGFGTREWIRSFLADPMADRFLGRMKKPDGDPAHTRMSGWIEETLADHEEDADRKRLMDDFDAVAAYLGDESLQPGRLADLPLDTEGPAPAGAGEQLIQRGRRFFASVCNECHRYRGEHTGTFKAPEMMGYGSIEWIEFMITDPSHDTRYRSRGRERARMPSFQDQLTQRERQLIAEWIHLTRTPSKSVP